MSESWNHRRLTNRSLSCTRLIAAVLPLSLAATSTLPGQRPGTAASLRITRAIAKGPVKTLDLVGTFADGAGRLDLAPGSDTTGFPKSGYVLVSDTSGGALIVMPAEKAYGSMGAGARLGGFVEMWTPAGTLSDVKVIVDSLGPGEAIDGHPTTHYRVTAQFNLGIVSPNAPPAQATSAGVADFWQANIATKIVNPFLGLGGDSSPTDPIRALNDALRTVQKRLPGLTVKSETVATLSARGILITNQRVTTRLSNIRDTSVDVAALTIPPGYSRKGP